MNGQQNKQTGTENQNKTGTETISLNGEVVKSYEDGDFMVLVYKIIPEVSSPLEEFYMVSLDDTTTEIVWGVGADIEEALKNAEMAYDAIPPNLPNPFKKALDEYGDDNE